jgi:hypothetical protein
MDMIQPREYDRVFVTCGSTTVVGMQVELMCVDGSEAIIKDSRDEFTIVDLATLIEIICEASGTRELTDVVF